MRDMAESESCVALAFRDTRLSIFDLDNTLYPAECDLFAQIDVRMSAFIQDLLGLDPVAARKVQKRLYYVHGTTLSGLMAEHGIQPELFLEFVHDIDLDAGAACAGTRRGHRAPRRPQVHFHQRLGEAR